MQGNQNSAFTFLDRFLNVTEAKVTYLTRATPIDRFLEKTFLRLVPSSVTPNQITKFRLVSIPFIAIFLALDYYAIGTLLFLLSAFSDALDGALARTKRQITTWGTLYDPIFLVSSAYFRYKGRVVPAKTMGKTKMILQCLGVIFLLFYIVSGLPALLAAATYTLYLAVVFGLLSLFVFRSI